MLRRIAPGHLVTATDHDGLRVFSPTYRGRAEDPGARIDLTTTPFRFVCRAEGRLRLEAMIERESAWAPALAAMTPEARQAWHARMIVAVPARDRERLDTLPPAALAAVAQDAGPLQRGHFEASVAHGAHKSGALMMLGRFVATGPEENTLGLAPRAPVALPDGAPSPWRAPRRP